MRRRMAFSKAQDSRQSESPCQYAQGDLCMWSAWGANCVFAANIQWGVGDLWSKGLRSRQGCQVGLKGSASVRVLVNLESVEFVPALVTFYLCQPKRGGLGCWCLCFMWILYVAAHVTSHVNALRVRAQHHYCLNLQMEKWQPFPSAWSETSCRWALGWAPVAGQEVPGLEWLEEVVILPASLNIYIISKSQKNVNCII